MALELAKRKAEEEPTDLEAAGTSHGPTTSEPAISVGDLLGLLAEDNTLQKPSIFLGRVQVHEQTFMSVDQEQLPFVWKTGNSGDNSNGMFHPDGNFPGKNITFFPIFPNRPKFPVPFVWITSARLQVDRK